MNYLEKLRRINKFTGILFENKFVKWLIKSPSYLTLIWKFFFVIICEIFFINLGEKLNILIKSYIPPEEKLALGLVDIFVGGGSWLIVSITMFFTIMIFVLKMLEIIYKRKPSTKQILKLDEFIDVSQYNKFATPLDINLYGRDNEKKEITEKLNQNNFVLVSGKAGIGKSKVVIEVIKSYKKDFDYEIVCIYNRSADLFDDINTFFQGKKKYLIFIDDVNRVHNTLDYLIQLYPEKINDNTLKIIMTVRDYAKDKIIDILSNRKLSFDEVFIDKLEKNYIEDIIKKDFKILNPSYIKRIQYLSKGNPRLVVMISKIASESNNLATINDISNVYDIYYKSMSSEIKIFEDIELMKVFAIISFYRIVDKTNEIQVNQIEELFNLKINLFWEKVKVLNQLEIVDLYENEVVKVSDQILSTYLFYKIVFVENILDSDLFITKFFLIQNQKLNEVINPIINSFDFKKITNKLKNSFDKLKKEYEKDLDKEYELIKFFWYLDRTSNLVYLKKLIDNLSNEDIEKINNTKYSNDKILELIKVFSNDKENYENVIELMFTYYEKNNLISDKLLEILKNEFGFHLYSYKEDYSIQKFIIDFIVKKIQNENSGIYIDLLFEINEYYLQTQFKSTQLSDNKTISTNIFGLYEIPSLKSFRETIFENIFSLYKIEAKKVLDLLSEYEYGYEKKISEIENWDKDVITKCIYERFDSKNYLEVKTVLKLCKLWKKYSIDYDLSLERKFQHEYIEIEKIFYLDYLNFWDKDKDTEKIDELIKNKIFEYIKNYEITDIEKLLNNLSKIYSLNFGDNREYIFNTNLSKLLLVINNDMFIDVLNIIVKNDYNLNFNEDIIVSKLLKIKEKNEIEIFIDNLSPRFKNRYKFSFYKCLEEKYINNKDIKNLVELYSINEDIQLIPFHPIFLEKYTKIDKDIIIKISRILFEKSNINNRFLDGLEMFFDSNTDVIKLFKNDFTLLKLIYLKLDNYSKHFDYDSKTLCVILDLDSNFILDYLKQKDKEKSLHKKYEVLWERNNYQDIIEKITNYFYENQDIEIFGSKFRVFFNIKEHRDSQSELKDKQIDYLKIFIKKNINENEKIKFIFKDLILCLSNKQRKIFIKHILDLGIKFKDFKELSFEEYSKFWSGSAIPMYQKELEYFESLLDLFKGINRIEHKKYVEEIIEYKRNDIKREKKREFMDDF
ncbi:ATP-binding protein [Poseidonibacter antarcticus]|uniref:ATP-binding protein n=1 Tax=Poseidonibacter antarcticus TaxID=2478538 RepID=UPI000EF4757C|nr:ATP-binding protein [Poseidonibacter antarcticus]